MQLSKSTTHQKLADSVVIGKDILELLSSAMYVDPLSIYREYIQNAADAIDDARNASLYRGGKQPRIDITLDPLARSVRIRDNGSGVRNTVFNRRMTSLGASKKRETIARGFRGVGRLSGLGYCQELVMRSKAVEDNSVSEIRWDCRRFKEILRDNNFRGDAEALVRDVVSLSVMESKGHPEHFFEIEMLNVVRYKNDILLNEEALAGYLSETAPVPFSPKFNFGTSIAQHLKKYDQGESYKIFVNDSSDPIYRPFRDEIALNPQLKDSFVEVTFHEIPAISDGVDAIGWILHHGYYGALPDRLRIKGIRFRVGNIQVGNDSIMQALFPEARFNAWCVGEFHIIPSPKLIPNGRRDDFEHNNHYLNLQKHLTPIARSIAKTCRKVSSERNRKRLEAPAIPRGNAATLPSELDGIITNEHREVLQSHPRAQGALYLRILPLIARLSPTSKTARRIITGLLDDLATAPEK